ncbi:YSIRK-type signal peptide-containing protein [Streptococcus sp. zg-86]|uniref:YSIRK-type signal peptide-containing protein n=1 Tax=Streptococcus zhangguiae TaxID=2664091 RepID=A0A6I4R9L5_9STRE|nr:MULTISPECIES: ZmpA/ZmpB/ZmpC family metallo-endopeptidase [unclassified Streptococcus]MTB64489.1 YSIRK-type signal peptide-containing protein [Streptococcus sp. zg-86]MTB90821.1 YSIRK-type signal peptide-containing protein [Streptococcus sp. zg-36]MWV56476.1 YSIRK-type signal peptide-containing protein [Streptococcus sp. zg-70]QTH47317.1 YSIRK-type signal peptide-containing protein [Streptococcus sp. zg-86]
MKEFYRQISRFSIRKFSIGAASVLLGMSLVGALSPTLVQANEQEGTAHITYHYVSEDELTEDEKKLITRSLPSDFVSGDTTYYMVYRPLPSGQQVLPATGMEERSILPIIAGAALLVCAVTFHKKKKAWLATAFVVTSFGQVLSMPEVAAITHNLFAHYTQEFDLTNGVALPETVREIAGYRFVGYIVESTPRVAMDKLEPPKIENELSAEIEESTQPLEEAPFIEQSTLPVDEVPRSEVSSANLPTVSKPVVPIEEVPVDSDQGQNPPADSTPNPEENTSVTNEDTPNAPTEPSKPTQEDPVPSDSTPNPEENTSVTNENTPNAPTEPSKSIQENPVSSNSTPSLEENTGSTNGDTPETPIESTNPTQGDSVPSESTQTSEENPTPDKESSSEVPTNPVEPEVTEDPVTPEPEKHADVLGEEVLTVTKPLAPLELMVAADKLDQGSQKEVDTTNKTPESVAAYQAAREKALAILAEANAVIVNQAASSESILEAQQKAEEALKNLEAAEAALQNRSLTKPNLNLQTLEKQDKDKSVRVTYQLMDPDNAFISATARIYAGEKFVKEVQLSKENLTGVVIPGLDYDVEYKIKTTFDYATIAEKASEALPDSDAFILERKQIELKNLRDLALYTYKNGVKTKVISLEEVGAVSDYFASFVSENGKEVQLPIKEIVAEGNAFKVIATHPELVQRNAAGNYEDDYSFRIGRIAPGQNGIYTSFKDLINSINANPSGTFTLGADLGAGELDKPEASYVTVPFTGTLNGLHDGKNYTIYGLQAPLFESTNGATLSNLNLADAAIKSGKPDVATLVNTAQNTTIRNVALSGEIEAPNNVASLVYDALNTTIQDVEADLAIRTTATTGKMLSGGLVGRLRDSSIEKAHINATIDTTVNPEQYFGGIVGTAEGTKTKIEDVYVEGLLDNKKGGRVGALAGSAGRAILNRIVSGITVKGGADYVGSGTQEKATDIYRIANRSTANVKSNKISEVTADIATEKIKAMGLMATLTDKESAVGQTSKMIDYSSLPNYEVVREIAYRNTEKLLPFYNREYIVKQGNKIAPSSKLYTTKLVSVVPMKDKQVVADFYKDKGAINRLLLNYEDGTVEYLAVAPGSTFAADTIQEYKVAGTDLLYTPEQFMSDPSEVIATAMKRVEGLTYFSEDVWKVTQGHPEKETDTPNLSPIEPYQKEILEVLYLKDSFKEVHSRAREVFEAALSQSVAGDFTTTPLKEQMKDYLKKNAVAILVGASYLNRLYKIQFGDMNVGELATFYQNFFGKQVNSLEWLANLGRMGNDALDIKNNPATYEKWIAPVSGYTNLRDYLSAYRTRFTALSENNWFKSATKAHIAEVQSKELPDQTYQVYDQLNRIDHPRMILPLLNLTSEGIYIMSNMTTLSFGMYDRYMDMSLKETNPEKYASELERVNNLVDYFAKTQGDHFDFWYRIAKPEVKERLYNRRDMPIPSWDGYLIPQFGNKASHWMPKFGEGASSRMTDFFAPIGKYYTSNGLGAYATGYLVHFVLDGMLNLYGQSVFTHEMVHNLDGTIYLGGYGRREAFGAEIYAQGLLQSTSSATNQIFALNTHADFSTVDGGKFANNRVHNLSPDRFQSEADLKDYLQGRMDVIYTLEALEGNALVDLPKEDQALFYKKIERLNELGESKIRQMTAEELNLLTFTSVDDLVDNDILLGTHGFHGNKEKIGKNGYETEVLFAANYSGLTNPHGSVDSLSIKRLSNELLAETGYDGFIAYLSNQYRAAALAEGKTFNDEYILKKITNGQYADFHAFKKAMYKRRLEKVAQLKPVTFTYNKQTYTANQDTIKQLINEAVQADLAAFKAKKATNSLFALKEAIYRAYLLDTDDFRSSIYRS